MEAEVRHHGHGDDVDAEMEGEHREDLVAVDRLAGPVDREHAVAVAVEGDPEVVAADAHRLLEQREIGRAAAVVDVRPGEAAIAVTSAPSRSKACGAIAEAPFAQSTAILIPERSVPKRSRMCSR